MKEYLKSGREALRLLYVLVISLAVTNSMTVLFVFQNQFKLPSLDNKLFLFLVFLSFISRFFLGAYRVLSQNIEIELRRPKIVIDTIGFYLQALLFYIYSINYNDEIFSQWIIVIICSIDFIWLLYLNLRYGVRESTFYEWMIHNLFFILFCISNILWFNNIIILLIFALIAFLLDFIINANFYFPKTHVSLRIFVAGPYGDNEPSEIIIKNIQTASDVGKSLALKGHFPFIPHTMLQGWEKDKRFSTDTFKNIDFEWLDYCDALFLVAPSPGADVEMEIAKRKGLQIFKSLQEVQDITTKNNNSN